MSIRSDGTEALDNLTFGDFPPNCVEFCFNTVFSYCDAGDDMFENDFCMFDLKDVGNDALLGCLIIDVYLS